MTKKLELDCKWTFPQVPDETGDEGPNSALSAPFEGQFPCASLVRESIQNSLDAALDSKTPVIVCFEYRDFDKANYPNFFRLSDHIRLCQAYYPGNRTAAQRYPTMANYLESSQEIGFIRVSDYMTKGMSYQKGDTKSPFYAFVRSAGVNVKQDEGAGGSFGFGKGAFFGMSPIGTLLVSSCDEAKNLCFEGVARLCTHRKEKNENSENNGKLSHIGFYDSSDGEPTTDEDKIPKPFSRITNGEKVSGTSIGIMGIKKDDWDAKVDEIVKEVLSNFFVAIHRGKLVVYVNGNHYTQSRHTTKIDSSTLNELMTRYFPDTKDVNRRNNFNPRPYYEAMTAEDARHFEEDLPTLGRVELHMKAFDSSSTMVIYLRKLLMKVYRNAQSMGNYSGVFICENERGNKILCDMENPAHNVWDPNRCNQDGVETTLATAREAKREIDKFVQNCLDELLDIKNSKPVQVSNLEKYLRADENLPGKGDKGNPFTGRTTGKYVDDGASLTTDGTLPPDNNPPRKSRKGNVATITLGTFTNDPNGDHVGGTGGNNNGSGGTTNGPGDNFNPGTIGDGNGGVKQVVEVDWRPIQSVKKGFTDIVIYSPIDIEAAELKFQIGREQSRKTDVDDVAITSTTKGKACGLTITDVPLKGNGQRNIVRIAFSDNMLHTLTLAVYEAN